MFMGGLSAKVALGMKLAQSCLHCGALGLHPFTEKRTFDFFRLLFIPYKTVDGIRCESCKTTYQPEQLSPELKGLRVKMPLCYRLGIFFFPFVLTLIVGWFFIEHVLEDEYRAHKIQAYLKDPRVGDHLIIKNKKDPKSLYMIYTITSIDGEKVTYKVSQFSFSKMEGVKDHLLNPQFDMGQGVFSIRQDELKAFPIQEIFGSPRSVAP